MCVRILLFNPSLQIASQSLRDCSDAAGDVNSMYSTPKSDRALAILILVSVSKKAFANYRLAQRLLVSCSYFDDWNYTDLLALCPGKRNQTRTEAVAVE